MLAAALRVISVCLVTTSKRKTHLAAGLLKLVIGIADVAGDHILAAIWIYCGVVALETFWGGLALAALTGLGWLAYQHPKSYARIYPWLAGVGLVIMTVAGSFSIGHQIGWFDAVNSIEPRPTLPHQPLFDINLLIGGIIAFASVNVLFVFMHQILGLKQDDVRPPKD